MMTTLDIGKAFDKIAKQPELEFCEGDYIKDGLLYCGKCHSKRQTKIEVMGKIILRVCKCKCRLEKQAKENAEFNARKEQNKLDDRMRTAIRSKSYENWTFDIDDGKEPKMSKMRAYAESFEDALKNNLGLLLWGDVGTGKSFAAACIVNHLVKNGYRCYMTTFTALANTIQGLYGDEKNTFIQSLNNFHLLVIDDLGAERQSEYMQEMVFQVIDGRKRANKPLIVTTNLILQEIKEPKQMGVARIYSRLDEMTTPINFTIQRRKEVGKQKMSKLAEILQEG